MSFSRRTALALVFALPLTAQAQMPTNLTPGYHIDYQQLRTGDRQAYIVNDSSQPIEAYHYTEQCLSADHRPFGGNDTGDDSLSIGSGGAGSVTGPNGTHALSTNAVPPGGRWGAFITIQRPPGKTCDSKLTVLYADGSYDGSEAALRIIKAARDGIVDGVRYWNDHLRQANESGKASDVSTLLAFSQEVKRRLDLDDTMQRRYRINTLDYNATPLLQRYWSGRLQVDRDIARHFPADQMLTIDHNPGLMDPSTVAGYFHTVSYFADAWQRKIDNDAAMAALNLHYPPISDPTESQQASIIH